MSAILARPLTARRANVNTRPVPTKSRGIHLKLHSKLDALEKLGKYLGAWGKDASVVIPPPVATTQAREFNWDALTQDELEQLNAIHRRLTAAAGPNA